MEALPALGPPLLQAALLLVIAAIVILRSPLADLSGLAELLSYKMSSLGLASVLHGRSWTALFNVFSTSPSSPLPVEDYSESEDIADGSPDSVRPPPGLANVRYSSQNAPESQAILFAKQEGQYCYLNSALQALASITSCQPFLRTLCDLSITV